MNHVAVGISEDLDFNMARTLDQTLQDQIPITEGAFGLGAGQFDTLSQVVKGSHPSHATSAATGGCLDHHRHPHGLCLPIEGIH